MKKGKASISRKRCSIKTSKKEFTESWHEEYRGQRTSLYGNSRALLEVAVGRKSIA